MPIDFTAIERIVVAASHLPTNKHQRDACHELTALSPKEKLAVLRLFVERDRRRRAEGRSGDWVPHVFITGAIGPREVLPWSRDDVEFVLQAITEETGVLPPALAVRAVKQLAEGAELDAKLRRLIERAAHAMWPDDDGEGVAFRDAAAALRALIGAPARAKKPRPKKAPVRPAKKPARAPAARARSKGPARASFADAVKRHMKSACPGYRYLTTSGGSGPLVTFERRSSTKVRHLRERVVFQKGLHGASWFRVNLFADVVAMGANGALEHTVLEGATLGRDVRYASDTELEAALGDACGGLERGAAAAFAPAEKRYPALEKLFGGLMKHYTRFVTTDGAKLAAADFFEVEGKDPPTIPAFDAFLRFLAKQKLTLADPKLDLTTPLWRFWHNGRPMRASDYQRDDYYDCSKCGAFVSFRRGRLAPRKLAGFGVHHAFVCAKH